MLEMRNSIWKAAALSAFIIIFLAVPLYWGSALKEADAPKALRVLFIGNSLTYSNDLPAVVEAFTKSTDQRPFRYKTIAFPDFSLEDHWNKKDARKAIARGEWDFVVMQQGPSASKEGRALLLEYARRFAEDIRKTGARPALYSVWPSASRMQDFNGVGESYRQAAADVDGLVFPVGEAWLTAWRANPSLGLYSADGFHPSSAGTYLAGLVIYGQLYNRSPVGLPFKLVLGSGARIEIPADQAMVLQHAAEETMKKL